MKKSSLLIVSTLMVSISSLHADEYSSVKTKRRYSSVQNEELENTSSQQILNQNLNLPKTSINGISFSIGSGINNKLRTSNFNISSLDPNIQIENGNSQNTSEPLSITNITVGVGYSYLPIENIGIISSMSYSRGKVSDVGNTTSVNRIRAEFNLAYTANQNLDLHAGPNLSLLTFDSKDLTDVQSKKYSPLLGYQAGLGIHINNNVGLSIDYFEDNSRASFDYIDLLHTSFDTKISGVRTNFVISF